MKRLLLEQRRENLMAKVNVAAIDRRPTRFYRDTVSPEWAYSAHRVCSRQPQGRGTGHAKHSPRAATTFHRLISVKSVTMLVLLDCTRRLTSPHISPRGPRVALLHFNASVYGLVAHCVTLRLSSRPARAIDGSNNNRSDRYLDIIFTFAR